MARARQLPYKELSLPQLRSFIEVCRCGGYAPAARVLMLSSPAVWEQLRSLERHFGLPLLERVGNGVRPTPNGQRFLELIRPLIAGLDSIKDVLHQQSGALPERITIISNLRVLVDTISAAMRQFQRRYPSIQLRIRYSGLEAIVPTLAGGKADLAVTLEPEPDQTEMAAMAYEPAGEIDYLLVTPPRHELIRARSLKLRDIVKYPLVLADGEAYSRHRVQEVFHRHGRAHAMSLAVETSSDAYTFACVRAGMGVGITAGTPCSSLCRGLGVRVLRRWFGTARVGFLRCEGAYVPPAQADLENTIRARFVDHERQRESPHRRAGGTRRRA